MKYHLYILILSFVFILAACTQQTKVTTPEQATVPVQSGNSFGSPKVLKDTLKWATFEKDGITIEYPASWIIVDNYFIAEKSFIPGEINPEETYNIIDIQKYSSNIAANQTNKQLFEKYYNLTQAYSDQRNIINKISSGEIVTGERYVTFSVEPSESFVGQARNLIQVYILRDQAIYQLTLSEFNDEGREVFMKMIPLSRLN